MTAITGQPAYRQIAEDLRSKIGDGSYPVGAALPSTSQLMEIYGVSITAVRAAVRELQSEGLLIGQPGKGVYVAAQPKVRADQVDTHAQLASLSETVRRLEERVAKLEAERAV